MASREKSLTVRSHPELAAEVSALSVYRRVGARMFDRAAVDTGLTPTELRMALRVALSRPTLTSPTLRAWRRGTKPVPAAALLAVCDLAGKRPAEIVDRLRKENSGGDFGKDGWELLARL